MLLDAGLLERVMGACDRGVFEGNPFRNFWRILLQCTGHQSLCSWPCCTPHLAPSKQPLTLPLLLSFK